MADYKFIGQGYPRVPTYLITWCWSSLNCSSHLIGSTPALWIGQDLWHSWNEHMLNFDLLFFSFLVRLSAPCGYIFPGCPSAGGDCEQSRRLYSGCEQRRFAIWSTSRSRAYRASTDWTQLSGTRGSAVDATRWAVCSPLLPLQGVLGGRPNFTQQQTQQTTERSELQTAGYSAIHHR